MRKIDPDQLRELASQKLSAGEIADRLQCARNVVQQLARKHDISIDGYKPRDDKYVYDARPYLPTDDEIGKRIKDYAASLGIVNECTTRQATAEELAQYDGLKPEPTDLYYEKWSDS